MSKILKEYGIEEDPRYRQCFKEAMAVLYLYIAHMIIVLGCVYFLWYLGNKQSQVLGFPSYIFWGVIIVSIGLIISVWLLVKFYYKDIPLEADLYKDENVHLEISQNNVDSGNR